MANIINSEERLIRFMSNSYNCLMRFLISIKENSLLLNKALVVSGISRSGAIRMWVSIIWDCLRERATFESSSSINYFTQTDASTTNISETPASFGLPLRYSNLWEPYGVIGQSPLRRATSWLCRERDAQLKVQLILNWLSFFTPPPSLTISHKLAFVKETSDFCFMVKESINRIPLRKSSSAFSEGLGRS